MTRNLYLVFNGVAPDLLLEVARRLHRNGYVSSIGAMTYTRETYDRLATLDEPTVDPLHFVGDAHEEVSEVEIDADRIETLENRFGIPFLEPYSRVDPAYESVSRSARLRCVQGWFDLYETIFEDAPPDLLLTNFIDGAYAFVPFQMTSREHGHAVTWKTTRVRARYGIQIDDPYDEFAGFSRRYEAIRDDSIDDSASDSSRQQAEAYLASKRETGERPEYFSRREQTFGLSVGGYLSRDLRRVSGELLHPTRRTDFLHEAYSDPTRRGVIGELLRRTYRRARVSHLDLFTHPSLEAEYLFVPLHAEPEPSTRLLAPTVVDQVTLVRELAAATPIDCRILVKEHPRMFRDSPRSLDAYRRLASTPKVELVDPAVDADPLIEGARAVATVTGTPAFEAVMMERPALTFGRAHFNRLSGVRRCDGPGDLEAAVEWAFRDYEHDEREVLEYLTALFETSLDLEPGLFSAGPEDQQDLGRRVAAAVEGHLDDLLAA